MSQTKKSKHTRNKRFKAYLIYDYINSNNISQEKFAEIANIGDGQLKGILNATTTNPPIDVLIKISNTLGVTLDYFCNNSVDNSYENLILDELGLSHDTAKLLKENKVRQIIRTTDKRKYDINKKNYNAILNLMLESKIPNGIGAKSFMELFNQNVLNLLICSAGVDKTFMETFKDDFANLSSCINANKTKPIKSDNIDMTFNDIFNSATIQKVYKNATHELHDTIDKLLETALKESFDFINPNTTLF